MFEELKKRVEENLDDDYIIFINNIVERINDLIIKDSDYSKIKHVLNYKFKQNKKKQYFIFKSYYGSIKIEYDIIPLIMKIKSKSFINNEVNKDYFAFRIVEYDSESDCYIKKFCNIECSYENVEEFENYLIKLINVLINYNLNIKS